MFLLAIDILRFGFALYFFRVIFKVIPSLYCNLNILLHTDDKEDARDSATSVAAGIIVLLMGSFFIHYATLDFLFKYDEIFNRILPLLTK